MKKNFRLHIDTSESKSTRLTFKLPDGNDDISVVYEKDTRQIVMDLYTVCQEKSLTIERDIELITVNTGPGSFTGVRIGIAVAKTIGLLLGIPVNGKHPVSDISPTYAKSVFD